MTFRTVLGGLLAWLGLTLLQVALLIGLALSAYATTKGLGFGDDPALGAALALPVIVALAAEFGLARTPLAWLRLSQNPLFLLPP